MPGTPKLTKILDAFAVSLQNNLQQVYEHFQKEGIELTLFSWCYITLFICRGPLDFSERVMDMFLYEGEQIIHSILLKMLSLKKNKILRMKFEELFGFLNDGLVKECCQEYHFTTLLSPIGFMEEIEEEYDIL